ncbi:AimR family lysis-lysogeny pheromone receptor [Halalkalibacter kiskunsagensis]|uniref:AimR family lysis-lysogeny pheromone receptor n=1 Tax=Halalkalibacter kiskunsagensis TaxID=1548599 RepID=A0ABV6KIG2_9BACI
MVMKEVITSQTFSSIENEEQFISNVDPESYLARVSLEYFVINSKSNLVEKLIDRLLTSSSEESKEWAEVYQIDHLVYKQKMNLIEATQQLTYKKVISPELATLIKIFQLYNYASLKKFDMIASLSELVKVEIGMLNDGYMKTSLLCRYKITMQNVYLHLNKVKNSRDCGSELLEIALTPTMKAVALLSLGNSYIIDDMQKAIDYFVESVSISEQIGHEMLIADAQSSMNFTYCYWDKPDKICSEVLNTDSLSNTQGYAYYLIKSNKKDEALTLLDSIEIKIDSDYLKAFDQYYRGLISGDSTFFRGSIMYFEIAGDFYYRQLPLHELK